MKKVPGIIILFILFFSMPAFAENSNLNNKLFEAIKASDFNAVKECIKSGADVNLQIQESGLTPLVLAVCNANYNIAEYLIKHGANVNVKINTEMPTLEFAGVTPIMFAISLKKIDIVELLAKNGANVNEKIEKYVFFNDETKRTENYSGRTMLEFAYETRDRATFDIVCKVTQDSQKKHIETLQKKALQGDIDTQIYLGNLYCEENADYTYSKEHLNPKETGNIDIDVNGGAQNFSEAAKWFEKAAAQGNPEAQAKLGQLYSNSNGVPKDINKALDCLNKSASQGNAEAQRVLKTINQNEAKNKEDFKFAENLALQGDVMWLINLGRMYENGTGVTQDFIKALACYNIASSADGTWSTTAHYVGKALMERMTETQIEKAKEKSKELLDKIRENILANEKNR